MDYKSMVVYLKNTNHTIKLLYTYFYILIYEFYRYGV